MYKKKTILIFGISSFLGSNIAEMLKDEYRIVGTYYDTPVDIEGIATIKCDVHNKSMVQKVILLFQPEITIYSVGLTRLSDCQDYPKLADALNTAGVFNVSAASERYHSKFIYFSSSYIFSGEDIPFSEGDSPTPLSIYGNTAASAEFYIQKSCLNYLILRCPPIFGKSINPNDMTLIETLEREFVLAKNISCDDKIQTGFIDIYTFCDTLKRIIESEVTNRLIQVSSNDIVSYYDFAKMYFESMNLSTTLLTRGDWQFPRTENKVALQDLGEELKFRMDITNLKNDFGINPGSVREMIKKFLARHNCSGEKKSKSMTSINFI